MSGHRPFSELTKNFIPERRRRVAKMTNELRAEIELLEEMRAVEKSDATSKTPSDVLVSKDGLIP